MLLLAIFLASFVIAHPTPEFIAHRAPKVLEEVTIFVPPSTYTIPRTLYARTLLLETDGDETDGNLGKLFPRTSIFPDIPIYGHEFGGFPAGAILCAGNSIPADLSATQIDLYASTDKGLTWTFVSHIASGGVAEPVNGDTPVWEPFLMLYQDEMIVYYSDQRDPDFGQKLVHQTSTDLLTWEAAVNDVAYDVFDDRPGMTTVALLPNGSYIMTYEFFGAPEASFAVYYRISDDPTAFDLAPGQVLRATDGTIPTSSPYITWSSVGGANGILAMAHYIICRTPDN
ncbi:glycoside hydrolase family 93 protein [Lentinula edodes]|uniref:Glycoside hydrolase family 93 protein n=1 Tax=Lentinula edodes TaxID=5353 RepID=A0A1Q3EJG8_LENED|nr:glycoside hydrolase family 93 protein [Lentinula edodes]